VSFSIAHTRCSLLFTGIALAGACADAPPAETASEDARPAARIVDGSCADIYGSSVCTWAKVEGERIVEIGATVPLAVAEHAPPDQEMTWPPTVAALIPMPAEVTEQLGVHDLKVYWEAHGHPPGPYLVPHFDFHFYTASAAQIDAIDCASTEKPTALPEGYDLPDVDIPEIGTLIGLCVPEMGMHALLVEEMESSETFSGTMVVGYYEGTPIHFEPMVTKDLLMAEETFSLAMPAIPGMPEGVVLPTHFEAVYDETASAYEFVFSGFPTT
jgi:hypothetical protein